MENTQMLLALYALVVFTVALFLVAGTGLLKLSRPGSRADAREADVREADVDVSRYRPMGRLLLGRDDEFLIARGMGVRAVRQFRTERRRVFRSYLRSLRLDFGCLTHAVRLAMVHSTEPRADLDKALSRAQLVFVFALARVEFRLMLHALGLNSVTIDVRPLITALEQMHGQHDDFAALTAMA